MEGQSTKRSKCSPGLGLAISFAWLVTTVGWFLMMMMMLLTDDDDDDDGDDDNGTLPPPLLGLRVSQNQSGYDN